MNLPDLGFIYNWTPSEKKSKSALLLLHGTGGTEDDLLDLGRLIAPDYNLLAPRGKVIENGKNRFFKRKSVGVFDVEDLKHRAIQLSDFVNRAKKSFDLEKVIAVGYSNGANIASGVIFHDPEILAGAILLRPMVPYIPEEVDLSKTKILMISGILDKTMGEDEAENLEQIFRSHGAFLSAHNLNATHGLATDDIRTSKDWIKNNFDIL